MRFSPTRWSLALALVAACGTSTGTPDGTSFDVIDAAVDATPETAADTALPDPTVALAEGTVRGTRGNGYLEFLGIPYAAPPVGPLRWRAPQPPMPWTGARDATVRPPHCPQSLIGSTSGVEDCLFVNVDTPDPVPHGAPVIVWIHGGAFAVGEGIQTDGGTRGDVLARTRGVVVVSMNYRLGALGFVAHPALAADGGGHAGNYGLLDQVAAMQWVQTHVAAFGGDPSNVTLAGESAGGISVCAHLVSPMSTGLFRRAVVESGPCGLPVPTLTAAEAQGARLATALHCDTASDVASCMRAASADQVLAALPDPPGFISNDPMYGQWTPVIDGAFLPSPPMDLLRAGTFAHAPLLFGWNHDEGTLFVYLANQLGLTPAQYPVAIRALVNGDATRANQVLAQYPLSAYATPWQAFAAALGDYAIVCSARRVLRAIAPFVPSTYAYQFTYPNASFLLAPPVSLGAFHSAEVQYVFGHPSQLGRASFVGADETLHQVVQGYWTRFATAGDPNGEGAPMWPLYTNAGDADLRLDVMPQSETGASAATCTFWESLGLYP
jgi:para-nitrobenzyl esterase